MDRSGWALVLAVLNLCVLLPELVNRNHFASRYQATVCRPSPFIHRPDQLFMDSHPLLSSFFAWNEKKKCPICSRTLLHVAVTVSCNH